MTAGRLARIELGWFKGDSACEALAKNCHCGSGDPPGMDDNERLVLRLYPSRTGVIESMFLWGLVFALAALDNVTR